MLLKDYIKEWVLGYFVAESYDVRGFLPQRMKDKNVDGSMVYSEAYLDNALDLYK